MAPDRAPLTFDELWSQMESSPGPDESAAITALILPDGPELLTALLSVMHQGGAAWPLNPHLTAAEIQRQLDLLRPDRAILGPETSPAIEDLLQSRSVPIYRAKWEQAGPAGAFELRELSPESVSPAPSRERLPPETRLVLVSSGTTGLPKIVPLSIGNLGAMLANSRRCYELTPDGRYLGLTPLFHLHGIVNALAQLAAGGSVVCPSGFDAGAFPVWLREYRPTWYSGGPAVHRAVASLAGSGAKLCTESLRFARSSSAPLDSGTQEAVERALGVPVIDSYGLSEGGGITANPLPPRRRKPGSCGVSVGPEILIVDLDHRPLPAGTEGEILVRGANVFAGYWGDPAANEEAFRDGWLRTGDLGRLDEDGYLFITGRRKDVINRGGMKLMPAEIEAVLLQHPGVAQAAVFGVPHPGLGEDLDAAVVARSGVPVTAAQLRAYAAQHLAAFKVPRRIHFIPEIPITATGKPLRAELRRRFEPLPLPRRSPERALTPMESHLASIWSRVLNRPEIRPQDDLFALGGDSLAAAIILAEVQSQYALAQPLFPFFECPTVENLARLVSERRKESMRPAAIHLSGEGPRTPVFCVPATNGDPYYLRHLAARLDRGRPFFALASFGSGSPASVEEIARSAVADIRAAYPSGPYILAGHCFGGVIAFEAARRLRAEGHAVRLVLLLDSPTPGYPKVLRRWKRYAPAAWDLLRSAGPRKLLRESSRHFRKLVQKRRNTQSAGPPLHSYSPEPIDVPVVQVLSQDTQASTRVLEDGRLGWRDFSRAGFRVVPAPGDHDSFLLPPHVDEAVRGVQAVLDESAC